MVTLYHSFLDIVNDMGSDIDLKVDITSARTDDFVSVNLQSSNHPSVKMFSSVTTVVATTQL